VRDVCTTGGECTPATPLIAFLLTTWRVAKVGVETVASTVATILPVQYAARVLARLQQDRVTSLLLLRSLVWVTAICCSCDWPGIRSKPRFLVGAHDASFPTFAKTNLWGPGSGQGSGQGPRPLRGNDSGVLRTIRNANFCTFAQAGRHNLSCLI